jgi:hypothetical protein
MCDRRYCGCALRGANLTRLVAVAVVVVALAGATALQDLLDGILIALSVLTAGIVALFAMQVRASRKRAVRQVSATVAAAPRPVRAQAAVAAAPRPAPVVPAQARQAAGGSPRVSLDGEAPGQAVLGAIPAQL